MDYRKYQLGCFDDYHDSRDYNLQTVGVMKDADYPKEVKPIIKHPIRDQGNTGMCFAFSLAKVIETQHYMETGKQIKVSEGFIYWMKMFKGAEGMIPAWDLANQRNIGAVLESDFKAFGTWNDINIAMQSQDADMLKLKASELRSKTTLRLDISEVPAYLHLWKAGVVSVDVTESFYQTGSDGMVKPMSGKSYGGHAMYVDELVEINGQLYISGDNSWGTQWGKSGRFYIAIDNPCIKAFYGLVDVTPVTNEIVLKIGSKVMETSKGPVELDVAPFITEEGRTVVPLRAISEAFGKAVEWHPSGEEGNINSKIVIKMPQNVSDLLIV